MRTYVYCIIFLNKYGRGLASKDLKNLGYMGSKYLVQILESRGSSLQGQLLELKLSYEQFQMSYSLLESNYQEVQRGLSSLQQEYKNLQDQVSHLEQVIESKDKSIQEYMTINENLQGMVANYTNMISVMEQDISTLFPTMAQSKLNKFVTERICYLYTSQRNLIHHLTCILFKVRCIIHNIDPLKGIAYVSKEQASVEAIYDNYISMMNMTNARGSNNPNKAEGGEQGGSNAGSFVLPSSSSGGSSFSAELNQKFLGRKSSSLLYAQQQQQKRVHCVNILRSKTQRLRTYIVSHKPHNILYYTPLMREKWVQWIREVESYKNEDKPTYLSDLTITLGDRKEKSEEDQMKQVLHREIAVALHFDYLTVSYIQTNITHDIYNIQHYIHTYKRAFSDAKEKLNAIHHKELEERRKRATDRSIISHTSSSHRQKKSRVMQIKQSYAHMLDTDLTGYLNNVLSAIETVQQTHGEMYYSNSKENTHAPNSPGACTDNIAVLIRQSSNKDMAEQLVLPSNAPLEIGGTIGRPQSGGRRRNSLRSTRGSMWDISQVPTAVKEEDENMLTGVSVVSGVVDPNESYTIIQDLQSESVHSKDSVHSAKCWRQREQGATITSPLPSVHEVETAQQVDNNNTDQLSAASISSIRSAASVPSSHAATIFSSQETRVGYHPTAASNVAETSQSFLQHSKDPNALKEAITADVKHAAIPTVTLPASATIPTTADATAASASASAADAPAQMPSVATDTDAAAAVVSVASDLPSSPTRAAVAVPAPAPVRRKSNAHLVTRAASSIDQIQETVIIPGQPVSERTVSAGRVAATDSVTKSESRLESLTIEREHVEDWVGGPGKLTSVGSVAQLKLLRSKKSSPIKSSSDMLHGEEEGFYGRKCSPSPPATPPVPSFPKEIFAAYSAPNELRQEEKGGMTTPPQIITTTASNSSVLGNSPIISRPGSPKRILSRPQTPLQASFHDGDDDDLDKDILDVEDEEDEVDDLQVLRKEIVAIMKRDKDQSDQISELAQQLHDTQQQLFACIQELPRLKDRVNQLFNDNTTLKEDLGKIISNYEETKHENSLLREVIYDSYRYQSKEIESILAKMQASMENKVNKYEKTMHKRLISTADQGTQIACSVCAIREYHQPTVTHDKFDSTGQVKVHEVLSSALGGNVKVLYPTGDFQSAMRRDIGYTQEPNVLPSASNLLQNTSQTTNPSYIDKVMSLLQSNPTSSSNQEASIPPAVTISIPPNTSLATRSTMDAPPVITQAISKKENRRTISANDAMLHSMNAGIADISSVHISHPIPSPNPSQAHNNPISTQILFDYAKSLLKQNRPRSALNTPSSPASGLPRPLSGLPRSGGGGEGRGMPVTVGRSGDDEYIDTHAHAHTQGMDDGSKFRKIKQIPRSHSADPNSLSQTQTYTLHAPHAHTQTYTPHTQTERQRQIQQRSDVNTAALLQDTQYINPLGQRKVREGYGV
ncbi:hypothetical protein EON65_20425, partial [archaeon]